MSWWDTVRTDHLECNCFLLAMAASSGNMEPTIFFWFDLTWRLRVSDTNTPRLLWILVMTDRKIACTLTILRTCSSYILSIWSVKLPYSLRSFWEQKKEYLIHTWRGIPHSSISGKSWFCPSSILRFWVGQAAGDNYPQFVRHFRQNRMPKTDIYEEYNENIM